MELIQLTCPNCNANLELEDGRNKYFCPYCGAKVVLDDNTVVHIYRDEARLRELEILEQRRKESIRARQRQKELYRENNRKWWIVHGLAVGIPVLCLLFGRILRSIVWFNLIGSILGILFLVLFFYAFFVSPFLKPIKPDDTWRRGHRKFFYFIVNYLVLGGILAIIT